MMAAGTDPVSWLLDRSRFVRAVSPTHSPGSDGIRPVSPLALKLLHTCAGRSSSGSGRGKAHESAQQGLVDGVNRD